MAVQITSQLQAIKPEQITPPISGDELFAMGGLGRAELVKGEIIHMSPTGHPHAFVEIRVGKVLGNFVDEHKLGRVLGGEMGVYTSRNPDTVRGVDVAFISNERLTQVQSSSYLDVAPELIVEIVSLGDTWTEITEKLEEYFAIGVKLIWVADPNRQRVHVYRSLTEVEILTVEDELTGGDVLPGFQVPVTELFA
jgi:Uma2 family endonuclease